MKSPSPFILAGIVENTEVQPGWNLDQKLFMLQLLEKKQIKNYVYVIKHIDYTDNWKDQFQVEFSTLKPFLDTCSRRGITLNIAFSISSNFDYLSDNHVNCLYEKILKFIQQGSVTQFSFLCHQLNQLTGNVII